MSIKVNGTEIPTNGIIKFNGTEVKTVVCNGTTVWTKAVTPKTFTVEISGNNGFGTTKQITVTGVDTSVYKTATLVISGGAFGYGGNGSYVCWNGTYYYNTGTFNVAVANNAQLLIRLGHDNYTVKAVLTFT